MNNEEMTQLVKLQVFIDHAFGVLPRSPNSAQTVRAAQLLPRVSTSSCGEGLSDMPVWDRNHAVTSFVRMAVHDTPEYRAMAQRLRRTEGYSMVDFLLQQGEGEKIETLSQRYGISAGHFRRLFRKETGKTPKAAIREWRLARAVLDFLDGRETITEIASEHGYASPSHFSNEARKVLGVSLSQLRGG